MGEATNVRPPGSGRHQAVSLEEAQKFVHRDLEALLAQRRDLNEALGYVLAEEIVASESVPGFTNAAMDGYALRASDTRADATRLRVVGALMAGDAASAPLRPGEALRIMTGAPMPEGADCVCRVEDVELDEAGTLVVVPRVVRRGENVRRPGEDVTRGQRLAGPGDELSATRLGVLASQGLTSLLVHPRPRVGVVSTGNELANTSRPFGDAMVRDVDRPLLMGLVRQSGCGVVDLGSVGDDATMITRVLREGVATCDAVISSGGVSVGDADFVTSAILDICGERARSMRVAIKPGKPLAYGTTGSPHRPLFGLPGNPVALLVSFELFVRPVLRRLAGHRELHRPAVAVTLDCAVPRQRDATLHLVHLVARFHDDGRLHAEQHARPGSHRLSANADANVMAFVPDGEGLKVGDVVPAMIIDAASLS